MGIETEKYIRKPLIVDAIRITADNFDEVASWCVGEVQADEVPGTGTTKRFIKVRVNNPKNPRQTKGFVGDWILYTDRGYKVYTNKAFRQAFDLVKDEQEESTIEGVRSHNGGTESDGTDEQPSGIIEVPQEMLEDHVESEDQITEAQPYVFGTTERAVITEDEARDAMGIPPKEEVEETPIAPPPTPAIVPPVTEQRPEIAAEGKRVLSMEEQRNLGQDEVRELIRSGDAILVQDLAESQQS